MTVDVSALVRSRLADADGGDELAFQGRWRSWRWMAALDEAIARIAGDAPAVGLVARTRPHHVAAFAGGLARTRTTVMIYAAQSPAGIAEDIRQLGLEAVIADAQDWSPEALAAARETGSAAIAIADTVSAADAVTLLAPKGHGPFRTADPDIALELLSSGTTGPPKRVPLRWSTLSSATEDARTVYAASTATHAPQVMTQPLGNVTGIAYLVPPLAYGQRIVLLEKFDPRGWADAIRDYKPVRASLPPAAIRMVLEAAIPREDLASLTVVGVGGGKVEADVHERFERDYGIPILHAFGATEFAGVVANWTLEAYREWGAKKRGSPGRASTNVELRIVDQDSFEPLPAGETGLLEAKAKRMGPDWIRTNDLASIDAEGFLFLHGRIDGAINRGGFKIVPDTVANALRGHPAVADAAVVGLPDPRLGEVPVAAVELAPGAQVDEATLERWARDHLLSYQVPVRLKIVAALPRNASLKISAPDVKALFA
jgi:acyl-CoA synthetase (AMP-forming)/AMP-acid ligase II